jgi:dihydroxy-acid dehydratase
MLKAVGFKDAELAKPLIGIANTWIEIGPCNYHLRDLAEHVREGIQAAGGTAMEFNTVSISDGITMGTSGMRMSLVSREVIADSIEMVVDGNQLDGVIALVGCDKTIPGAAMALARINVPGLVLYGGSIAPGVNGGKNVTIQDVFEAVGAHAAGRITTNQLIALEDVACPGAGACGGQFTANTMSGVCEFLGLSPMGSNNVPAVDAAKGAVARAAGQLVVDLVHRGVTPRQILTPAAFHNAIASVVATGGSTNAVLHLLAIAREASVDLDLELFNKMSASVPWLADLKPAGRFVATDLHKAGGTKLVAQRLLEMGVLKGEAMTVTLNDSGDVSQSIKLAKGVDPLNLGFVGYSEAGGSPALKATDTDFRLDGDLDNAINQSTAALSTLTSTQSTLAASKTALTSRLDYNKSMAAALKDSANSMTAADMAEEATTLAVLQNRQSFAAQNLSLTKQSEQFLLNLLR